MSTKAMSFNLGKCLLIVCIIPFLFACSKSKFSSVKTPPATVGDQQVDQPTPDTTDDGDDNDYNDNDQPPKVCPAGTQYDGHGHCVKKCDNGVDQNGHCKPCPLPPTCPKGTELDQYGKCKPICTTGYDNNGHCKPCPVTPTCPKGTELDQYGKCKPVCSTGYDNHGHCKPCPLPPTCPKGTELDQYGKCKPVCTTGLDNHGHCKPCPLPPEPTCNYGKDKYGKCLPKPVCKNGYNEDGSCKQCNGGCDQPPPKLCYDYEYDIPEYKGPREMYVWIVMDGSKSNTAERPSQVSALADMYARTIGRKMPIKIVVIAGHSKQSSESVLGGALFYPSTASNPVVTIDPRMSPSQRSQAVAKLRSQVQGMATDNSSGVSDGGELLVANLFAALSKENLARAEQLGVYGGGNLLNIHFIGDENDICTPGQVEDFNKITVDGVKMSREQYAYKYTCKAVKVDGKTYNLQAGSRGFSEELYKRLNAIKQSKAVELHLTGFLYTGEHNIPGTEADNENEIGHGMVELISAMHGRTYDLASLKDQSTQEYGASQLMGHINDEAGMNIKFRLANQTADYTNMDEEQTRVQVDNEEVRYSVNAKNKSFQLYNCPIEGKKARIHFCVKSGKKK